MDTLHTLPQELTDHIIDLLAVNLTSTAARKNFANYTLVCRAWTPHASQCLLKHIEVLASELPTFLDSIRSSKRFQTYTEELCILGAANMSIHWDSAFQALPHLCSLELWSNMLPRNEFSLLPNPTSTRKYRLAKLKIYCVELASIPFLLLPFSHVDILELRSLEAEPPEDGASDSYTGAMLDHQIQGSFPLTVNRLVLDDCCQKNALARLQLLLRPTALFANGFDRQEVSGISAFLLHTRESVEHINLLATQDDAPGYQIHVQNWNSGSLVDLKVLARCPKLTSITLDLVDVLWAQDLCRAVLSQMPSSMCRLRITLTEDQWEDIFNVVASHLRVNEGKYHNLEGLEFRGVCEDVDSGEEARALLAELRGEVETRLPPRYSVIAKVLP